ncbi:hypothetical protein B566_EDAN009697 [Ephemera danica]|nr:hypothetical protein B566_EDAN009697 [Ephemera danica]
MLAASKVVVSKVRVLLLWICGTLRRLCCCFKRRRRNSESQPLTAIGIVPNDQSGEAVTQGWDTWGKEEDDVTRQIREYRNSLSMARQQQQQPQEEQQADFFQDMTPRITRPPRITLKNDMEPQETNASSLLAAQPLPLVGGELGTWAEEEGWEAEEEGDWQEQVREQRRLQRQRRAEEMQMRRSEQRMGLGSRLS